MSSPVVPALFLTLLVLLPPPVAAQDLEFDPVAYWGFEPDASCGDLYADLTRNGHDGIPRGSVGPGPSVCGGESGSMSSDGSVGNYVEIPASPGLQAPLPVTISAWVRSPDPQRDCTNDNGGTPIFRNDFQEDMFAGVFLYASCSSILAGYGDAGGGNYDDWHARQTAYQLVADTWTHIAAVIRGHLDIDVYVDGQRIVNASWSGRGGDMAYTGSAGAIGLHDQTTVEGKIPSYAYGEIDEVAFFDRALSESEIVALYARGVDCEPVTESCPVAIEVTSFGALKARF